MGHIRCAAQPSTKNHVISLDPYYQPSLDLLLSGGLAHYALQQPARYSGMNAVEMVPAENPASQPQIEGICLTQWFSCGLTGLPRSSV
jgi:hypothetical protein